MPPRFTEAVKALGVTTPFIYAYAAYRVSCWLDAKSSGPTKRAISGWLEPKEYDRTAVQAAVLEIFDKVYTKSFLKRGQDHPFEAIGFIADLEKGTWPRNV